MTEEKTPDPEALAVMPADPADAATAAMAESADADQPKPPAWEKMATVLVFQASR